MSLRSTQSGFKPPRSSKPNILKTLQDMHRIFNEILDKSLQYSSNASHVMMYSEPVKQLSKLQGQQEILSSLCNSQDGVSKQLAYIQQTLELNFENMTIETGKSTEFISGDFAKVSKLLSKAQKQILGCIKNSGNDDNKLVTSVWDVFNTLNLDIWNKCFSNNLLQDSTSPSIDLRNKILELSDENTELRKQLSIIKAEMTTLKASIKKGDLEMTSPTHRRREKPRSVDRADNVPQLKKEIMSNYDMIRTLHTEIDEKTVLLEQKDSKVQDLTKELNSLKNRLKDKDPDLETMKSSTAFQRSPVRGFKFYQNEIEYLREQLGAARDEKEKTLRGTLQNNNEEALLKKIRVEHEKEVTRLKEHVDFLRKRLSELSGHGRSSRGFSPMNVSASTQSLMKSPSAENSSDVHERLQRERERSLTLYRALKRKERDLEEITKNPENKVSDLIRANNYLENKVNILEDEIKQQRKINSDLQQMLSESGFTVPSEMRIENNLSPLEEYIVPQPTRNRFNATLDFKTIDTDYERFTTDSFNPCHTGFSLTPKNLKSEFEKFINVKASENTKKLDSIFLNLTEKENKLKALEQKLAKASELKNRELNQLKSDLESKKAEIREALLVNNLDKEDFRFKFNKLKENQNSELENLYKEVDFLKEKMRKSESTETLCKNKDEERNKLLKDNEKLQAEVLSKNQQIDKLILEHTTYKSRHSENSEKLNNLMLDLLSKKDRFKTMKREIHDKDDEISRIRKLNEQLSNELKYFNEKVETVSKNYEELKTSYNQQRGEINTLQLKLTQSTKEELHIEKLRFENTKLNTENLNLKKQVEKLSEENESLKTSYDEQNEHMDELMEKLQANTNILEAAEADLESAREDCKRSKAENKKMNSILIKRNEQLNELKKDKEALSKILDEKMEEVRRLIDEYNKGNMLIEQLDIHNQDLKVKNNQYKEQLKDHKEKLEKLLGDFKALEDYAKEMREENEQLRAEIEQKENHIQEFGQNETLALKLQSDYQDLLSQKQSLQNEYSELLKEYETNTEELQQKSMKLSEKDKLTSEKEEDIRKLKGYNEKLTTENKILGNEVKKLSRDIDTLKQKYEVIVHENNSLKDMEDQFTKHKLESQERENLLESELSDKLKEIDHLQAENEDLRSELDSETHKLKLEIYKNLDEIKGLKIHIEKSETAHKKLIDSLQNALEDKNTEIDMVKVLNSDLEAILENSHSELHKIQEYEEQIQQLNSELEQVQLKYTKNTEKLQSEIQLCNHEILKITQIYENLKSENVDLKNKLSITSQEVSKLEKANEQIRSNYEMKLERLEQDLQSYTYNVGTLTEKYNELKFNFTEAKSSLESKNKELIESSQRLNDYNHRQLYFEDLIQQLKIELKTKDQELETYFLKQSDLVTGLSSRDDEVGLLLEQIKILQSENKNMIVLNYQYEDEILQKNQNVKRLENELEDLGYKSKKTTEKAKGRKVQIEGLKSQVQDAVSKLEVFLREKNELVAELENNQKETAELLRRYEELDGILNDQKQENIGFIEERLQQINNSQKLQDDIEQLKSQIQILKESSKQEVTALLKQLKSKEEDLDLHKKTLSSLTKECEDLRLQVKNLIEQLGSKDTEISDLQEKLQKKSMKHMSATLDLETATAQLNKASEENEEFVCEISSLEKELGIVRKEYDSLKQEFLDLTHEYRTLMQTLDALELKTEESKHLRDLINKREEEIQQLKQRNEQRERELIDKALEIDDLNEKLSHKDKEYKSVTDQFTSLTNELEFSKQLLQQQAQNIQNLRENQEQLEILKEKYDKLEKELKGKTFERDSLNEKLKQKDQEYDFARDQVSSLTDELEYGKQLIQQTAQEIQELRAKEEKLEILEERNEELDNEVSNKTLTIEKLNEKLAKKTQEYDAATDQVNELESSKQLLQQQIQNIEDQLETLKEKYEKLEKEHSEKALYIEELNETLVKKTQKYNFARDKISDLTNELESTQQLLQQTAHKIEELKKHEQNLQALNHTNQELNDEINSMKLQITHLEFQNDKLQHTNLSTSALTEENDSLKYEISQLKDKHQELSQLLDKNQELLDQIELLKFNNNYLQEKHKDLQHTIKTNQDLMHENTDLHQKLDQKDLEISMLQDNNLILSEENDLIQVKLELLENDKLELHKLKSLYSNLLEESTNLKSELKGFTDKDEDLVEIHRPYEDLDLENNKLRVNLAGYQKDISAISSKYEDLLISSSQVENTLKDEILNLNEQLLAASDNLLHLQVKIEAQSHQILNLTSQLSTYKSACSEYQDKISSNKSSISQSLNEFFEILRSNLEDQNFSLERFENRFTQLEFKFLNIRTICQKDNAKHSNNSELIQKMQSFEQLYNDKIQGLESDKLQLKSDYQNKLNLLASERENQVKDLEIKLEAFQTERDLIISEYENKLEILSERLTKSETSINESQNIGQDRCYSVPNVDKVTETEEIISLDLEKLSSMKRPLICDTDFASNDITPIVISESASRNNSLRTSRREASLSEISRESEGSNIITVINKYQEENYELENTIRLQSQQIKILNEEIKTLRSNLSTNQVYTNLMTIKNMFWGFATSLPTQTLEIEKVVKLILSVLGFTTEDIARCEAERISKRMASAPDKKNALAKFFHIKKK